MGLARWDMYNLFHSLLFALLYEFHRLALQRVVLKDLASLHLVMLL